MNPTLITFRRCAVAFAIATLTACTSPHLPKVATAKSRLGSQAMLRNETLADELKSLQAKPVASGSAETEKFIMELQRRVHIHDWKMPIRIEGESGLWELHFDDHPPTAQGRPEWSPSVFDRLIPASAFKLEGYDQIATGTGAGAPFVFAFENIKELRAQRNFRPGNSAYAPGTIVLEFGKPQQAGYPTPVQCHMINTFQYRTLKLHGNTVQLAWNVTAAIESNLGNNYIQTNGLIGLLHPDKRVKDVGVFGISPYDPKKTPVIFVHGLDSSPAIWKNIVNEIYNSPDLNQRYQPLLFMYPTGLSVPASAAKMRLSIQQFRNKWDPDHNDLGFHKIVLVGHSMGGLLSRMQVIDSGDDLRKAFFAKPIAEIPWISAAERKKMDAGLNFKASPEVTRVVFVAVPHRGSKIADNSIVRLFVRLISLPTQAANLVKTALIEDQSLLNPALLNYHSLGMTSVDMLSPGHPFFAAIDRRPIKVPYHSIIGDRGKGIGNKSSDGAVPYWSSHVDRAESELIVPYAHSCTDKTEVVQEILRILRAHGKGDS